MVFVALPREKTDHVLQWDRLGSLAIIMPSSL